MHCFVFQSEHKRENILISGDTGIGKTTFCSHLCRQWSLVVKGNQQSGFDDLTEEEKRELHEMTEEQKSILNGIGLLIYIPLQDIENSQTLKQLINSQLGFTNNPKRVLDYIFQQKFITVILDGFAETSQTQRYHTKTVNGILSGNTQCILLCRPHKCKDIISNMQQEIRFKGFSNAQAEAFIKKFAEYKYENTDDIKAFVSRTWADIFLSVDLLEMSTNPSMLQLLCQRSANHGKVVDDLTDLVKEYIHYLLLQFHRKKGEDPAGSMLYKVYDEYLVIAGKIALKALCQTRLKFVSKRNVDENAGDDLFDFCFLTEYPSNDHMDIKICFLLQALQEYLALYYIISSPANEKLHLLLQYCSTVERLIKSPKTIKVINSVCQRNAAVKHKWMAAFISGQSENTIEKSRTFFLMAMLTVDKSLRFPLPSVIHIDMLESELASGGVTSTLKHLLSKKTALDRLFLQDSKRVKKIVISTGEDTRLDVLLKRDLPTLHELEVDFRDTWQKYDFFHLSDVIKETRLYTLSLFNHKYCFGDIAGPWPSLQSLTVCKCTIYKKGFVTILKVALLTSLTIEKCDFTNEVLQRNKKTHKSAYIDCENTVDTDIMTALSKIVNLTSLSIISNNVEAVNELCHFLENALRVKTLNLNSCAIRTEEWEGVLHALNKHAATVEYLDLSRNNLSSSSHKRLVDLVKFMKDLRRLYLAYCELSSNMLVTLGSNICNTCNQLEVLDLDGNKLMSYCGKDFLKYIQGMNKLRELYLSKCDLSNDACVFLLSCLSDHCHYLGTLSLAFNNMSDDELTVVNHIKKIFQLRDIWINDNPCVAIPEQRQVISELLQGANPHLNVHTNPAHG